MEHTINLKTQSINRNKKLSDHGERDRLLMTYGGIFKNNISEFAERLAKVHRKRKNYAR